jgi:hypothetical protein
MISKDGIGKLGIERMIGEELTRCAITLLRLYYIQGLEKKKGAILLFVFIPKQSSVPSVILVAQSEKSAILVDTG